MEKSIKQMTASASRTISVGGTNVCCLFHQYGNFAKSWKLIFHNIQLYHSTQISLFLTTKLFANLCSLLISLYLIIFAFFFLDTGSLFVVLTVLELTMLSRMALNSHWSSCHRLSNSRIKCMGYHSWIAALVLMVRKF